MPISLKYGRITVERGALRDDEPCLVLPASDPFAAMVAEFYGRVQVDFDGNVASFFDAVHQADEMRLWSNQVADHVSDAIERNSIFRKADILAKARQDHPLPRTNEGVG
jgi:hypothetical protein